MKKVELWCRYLVWRTSQWQGSLDEGKIFTKEELKKYLEEIDREYIKILEEKTK